MRTDAERPREVPAAEARRSWLRLGFISLSWVCVAFAESTHGDLRLTGPELALGLDRKDSAAWRDAGRPLRPIRAA